MHKCIVQIPSGIRNFIASKSSLTDNSKLGTMAIVQPDCRVQNLTLYRSKVKTSKMAVCDRWDHMPHECEVESSHHLMYVLNRTT